LAGAAPYRSCGSIENPYAGTRYEGVDITRIRGLEVTCKKARRVARKAHRKALGITPPPSGIRRFTWRSWSVTGDLRGDHDRYVAKAAGGKRVRWRF
jgi:hypothetical protein